MKKNNLVSYEYARVFMEGFHHAKFDYTNSHLPAILEYSPMECFHHSPWEELKRMLMKNTTVTKVFLRKFLCIINLYSKMADF